MTFQLYYTFSHNSKKKLTKKEMKELINYSKELSKEASETFFLLIIEHYKVVEKKQPLSTNLPWEMEYDGKYVHIDIEKLPQAICSILYKFICVLKG